MPEVETSAVPAALAPHIEKLPEPVKGIATNFFKAVATPEEAQARSAAAAMSFIQLWAASQAPTIALFTALLVSSHLQTVEGHINKATSAAPALYLVPGAFAVIFVLNVLCWMSSLLSWVVMLVWMALAAHFAAELVCSNWKRAAKTAKGPEEAKEE